MATWKHKDIWTMKADTFEVKVTRSLEEEKNIWTTIVVIHPKNYLQYLLTHHQTAYH